VGTPSYYDSQYVSKLGKISKLGKKIQLSPTFYFTKIVEGIIIGKEYEIIALLNLNRKKMMKKRNLIKN
jgi:hypothetical protein